MEKQELQARRRREKTAKGEVGLQSGAAEEADDKKSVLAFASSISTTVTNTRQSVSSACLSTLPSLKGGMGGRSSPPTGMGRAAAAVSGDSISSTGDSPRTSVSSNEPSTSANSFSSPAGSVRRRSLHYQP